jgi:hypothetical protein
MCVCLINQPLDIARLLVMSSMAPSPTSQVAELNALFRDLVQTVRPPCVCFCAISAYLEGIEHTVDRVLDIRTWEHCVRHQLCSGSAAAGIRATAASTAGLEDVSNGMLL